MTPVDAYVICTSPRSGSTLLCGLLRNSGIAGLPESHFHEPSMNKWLDYYDLRDKSFCNPRDQIAAVFRAAQERGKGGGKVFGLRLQRHSFEYFTEQLRQLHPSCKNDVARLNAAFGKTRFIHLTRENKLEQAVSFVKAQQSGLWHMAPDGREIERLSEPKQLTYDPAAISNQLMQFEEMDAAWTAWFGQQDIEPLRVTYDALSAAPQKMLRTVLDALCLQSGKCEKITAHVGKMADEISQEWVKRFEREEMCR
ncbi:sulfotransferase [Sulfitobacter sp. TSTF-M16]|uniref:Sulfotransferase n=1 Tax=Sulfitobacter aestuariivivens TaxID=2766981 RepID=A0A927D5F6_9RHOB|nr:Stf0 family sulfotransferase [Sulfitobacter aestuariivivens]MBD3665535.1 sulfotransferase [Sulfitobacter aestuariivivens]